MFVCLIVLFLCFLNRQQGLWEINVVNEEIESIRILSNKFFESLVPKARFNLFTIQYLLMLTLSLLLPTQEAFVDNVDQDQTAQNVKSDL